MAIDKNELNSVLGKVPKISDSQSISPTSQLVFLYMQLTERKKMLFREQVQVKTATTFAEVDDNQANEVGLNQIREATGRMKALRWEINTLNKLIEEHLKSNKDITDVEKVSYGIE